MANTKEQKRYNKITNKRPWPQKKEAVWQFPLQQCAYGNSKHFPTWKTFTALTVQMRNPTRSSDQLLITTSRGTDATEADVSKRVCSTGKQHTVGWTAMLLFSKLIKIGVHIFPCLTHTHLLSLLHPFNPPMFLIMN